jgi:hypothetical protein
MYVILCEVKQRFGIALDLILLKKKKLFFKTCVKPVMTTTKTHKTMNSDQIKADLIKAAQAKLNAHSTQGRNSRLSIFEVAQLRDIVAGNVELNAHYNGQFFGLHSLN